MKANFCFDFVIAVSDHDTNVNKYATLLEIEPIELAPETLPLAGLRCSVFPLWNENDRGMVLSLVSSDDPGSPINAGIRARGEGFVLFGIDVDDVDAMVEQGKRAGVELLGETPSSYEYGRALYVEPGSTNNVPMFFSSHRPGWWGKTLAGGRDDDE